MQIGMPTLIEFKNIDENIAFAIKNDFNFIELNLNFGYVRKFLENKSIKNNENLFYTLHFFDEADFASYDAVCKAYIYLFKKYVKLASKINTKSINIHLNEGPVVTVNGEKTYIYELEFEYFITRLINNLRQLKKITTHYKMDLVIENIKIPPFMQKVYPILLNEGFNFNYDVGHDYTDSKWLYKFYKNNKNNFSEIHFHDASNNKCHLCLGSGELNLPLYFGLIRDKLIVLEVKSKDELAKSISTFKKLGEENEL